MEDRPSPGPDPQIPKRVYGKARQDEELPGNIACAAECQAIFCKPWPVHFALKDTASQELDQLEKAGILVKISHAELAAPVVLVPKGDGCLNLRGDYKMTIILSVEID